MSRRCTSERCLVAAGRRSMTLDLPTANVLYSPSRDWQRLSMGKRRIARDLSVRWSDFPQDQYLFTHSSIVASCVVGDNCHHVMAPTDELVNNNGNGWSNEVLLATFRSFIGAENFYEHDQRPEASKGKILDAVLRPVRYRSKTGSEADIYWCDILVATSREHESIVARIEDGKLNTMSMGVIADVCTCSKCGEEFVDDDRNCFHLDHEMMSYFKGDDGQMHIVAELIGRTYKDENGKKVGDPKSARFIEASWVEHPAFRGAVLNHFISEIPDATRMRQKRTSELRDVLSDMFRLRVADEETMVIMRVVWDELRRRRNEEIVDKVARSRLVDLCR